MFDAIPESPRHGTCCTCVHWHSFNRRVGWCGKASAEVTELPNVGIGSDSAIALSDALICGPNFYCAQYTRLGLPQTL